MAIPRRRGIGVGRRLNCLLIHWIFVMIIIEAGSVCSFITGCCSWRFDGVADLFTGGHGVNKLTQVWLAVCLFGWRVHGREHFAAACSDSKRPIRSRSGRSL